MQQLTADASGVDLTKKIYEIMQSLEIENPSDPALQYLRNEAQAGVL
jgi:hypothetical protein